MPLNGTQIITSVGEAKLMAAALGDGPSVSITHIALGDGLGLRYAPYPAQTALRRERARVPISSQAPVDENTFRIIGEFGADLDSFTVREIGFFDGAGDLIFVTAGTDMQEGVTGAFDLLFEGFLNLSGVADGLVVIEAPDDQIFKLAAVSLGSFATLSLHQLKQRDALVRLGANL